MIIQLALAIAPFFAKFSLYILDLFVKNKAEKEATKAAVIKAAIDYNASAAEQYNASKAHNDTMQEYLDALKEVNK
ncbi:MAG: hypothetical protein RLY43_894 [Bacteroidota bacterium]|jgi:hypothetical protein